MRKLLASLALAVGALGLATSTASAAPCPPGWTRECLPQKEPQKAGAPPPCRCVQAGGSGSGSQGKAEIKRKNVPQVKPNKPPPD